MTSPSPRPAATGRDATGTTTPTGVLVAVGAWYAVAAVVLTAALAAERVESATGVALGAVTSGTTTSPVGVLGVLLGIALLVGCVVLGLGHAVALRALVPLGVVAVLGAATTGSWLTLVLMALLLLGVLPLAGSRSLEHLGMRS